MLLKIILTILIIGAILWAVFNYFDVKDYFAKKGCLNDANMQKMAAKNANDLITSRGVPLSQPTDLNKIFNDAYQTCLKKHGITE